MEQRRDYNSRHSNKKPPRGPWKPNTCSWKKEFCKVVGQMEWGTFLHMMEFRHLSPHVNSWDSSAGKEALDNAWRRFWFKKKGVICDTPLPDPNLYNDVVDWDAEVDPDLCRDLENFRVHVVCHTEEQDTAPIVDYPLPNNQNILPTGWGDVDENLYPVPVYTPAWPNEGPSWVPPSVGPTFAGHLGGGYPTPGGGWSYNNNIYMGPPQLWNYNNVATSSSHAFGSGYTIWRAQADGGQRNQTGRLINGRNGWRKPAPPYFSRRQVADQPQDKRTQAK